MPTATFDPPMNQTTVRRAFTWPRIVALQSDPGARLSDHAWGRRGAAVSERRQICCDQRPY
jgi:hypothetical protein